MKAAWLVFFAAAALAQTGSDQTGSISGVVTDAVTRQPVKKAIVSVVPLGGMGGRGGPGAATTDAGGAFTIDNLQPGKYLLMFQQRSYPQIGAVSKHVEVKAGEASEQVSVELMPGAVLTGHVTDEDGDPLPGCFIQLHPPDDPEQGVPMLGSSPSNEDGEYRVFGVGAGKYIASSRCYQAVFQPRPFSAGPDPPPSRAYPEEYYPLTTEPKSAQAIQLTGGMEKSGVDFQMTPAAVTQIHGTFSPTGADWHSNQLAVRLISSDGRPASMGSTINKEKGTFEFRQVFPGSYTLMAMTFGDEDDRVGAWQKIDVNDRPMQMMVELKHAMDLSGKVEMEGNTNNSGNQGNSPQIQIALVPASRVGMPSTRAQVSEHGAFTLKGVLPAPWRLMVYGPNVFIKSAWLGSTEVTGAPLDLTGGAAAALRIVLSTNTATIRGSAPAGDMVEAQSAGDLPQFRVNRGTQADQNGQYVLQGLPPGKYRIIVADSYEQMPEEGGQEITVHEGETVSLDLKAPAAP